MVTPAAEDLVTAEPPRTRRGRWLAAAIVAVLAVVYLAAIKSTHVTLSQAAEQGTGGKAEIGFSVHNEGPVPITLLSMALAQPAPPDVVAALLLGPAGNANPSPGQMTPFHPLTLGPGDTVQAGLTERIWANSKYGSFAIAGPVVVVVRYRVLGVTMSRTLSPASSLGIPGGSRGRPGGLPHGHGEDVQGGVVASDVPERRQADRRDRLRGVDLYRLLEHVHRVP